MNTMAKETAASAAVAFASAQGRNSLLTVHRASLLLSSNAVTCQDLVRHCYALAEYGEDVLGLNAFANLLSFEDVLERAKDSDERRRCRRELSKTDFASCSPLEGIPVTIKANIAVRDLPLTAGSKILTPSGKKESGGGKGGCGYDADVVGSILRDCGAVLIGTTSMDEFGMGSLGTTTNVTGSVSGDNEGGSFWSGATVNPLSFCWTRSSSISFMGGEEVIDSRSLAQYTLSRIHQFEKQKNEIQPFLFSAGGSSCGSAASVCHGSSLVSLGSDTGGSIRLPASWCGIVGFKPTYGAISRYGLVAYASSLDTIGVLAPTPSCAALAYHSCLANRRRCQKGDNHGRSESGTGGARTIYCRDSTALYPNPIALSEILPESGSNDRAILSEKNGDCVLALPPLDGMRIGIPSAFSVEECPPIIRQIWKIGAERLRRRGGATLVEVPPDVVTPRTIKTCLSAYYVLACAEASSNLARYDGLRYGMDLHQEQAENSRHESPSPSSSLEQMYSTTRSAGFGMEVVRRIMAGTAVLSSDRFHTHYETASNLRVIVRREFDDAFRKLELDAMLVPTSLSSIPFSLNEGARIRGGSEQGAGEKEMLGNDVMTVPISLAGLPAVSVPVLLCNDKDTNHSKNSVDQKDGKHLGEAHLNGKDIVDFVGAAGLQVFGPPMSEEKVLKTASVLHELWSHS